MKPLEFNKKTLAPVEDTSTKTKVAVIANETLFTIAPFLRNKNVKKVKVTRIIK